MAPQFKIIQLIKIFTQRIWQGLNNLQGIVDNLNLVRGMVALPPLGLKEEVNRVVAKLEDREKAVVEVTTSQGLKYTSFQDSARHSYCTFFCHTMS